MARPMIYLDYNATTPLRPEALAAMQTALAAVGNPSSIHHFGRLARAALEKARRQVADAAGVKPGQVTFTSGATEANLTVLYGAAARGARILVSAVEHESVLAAAPQAERLPVTADGVVDAAALRALLANTPVPTLVVIQAVNNETGTIQPMAEIAEMTHAAGAFLHCDAAQALGKLPIPVNAWGIDTMTVSAHKAGGPAGVGALIHRTGPSPPPLLVGGGQERRQRGGTENLIGIIGFGAAAAAAVEQGPAEQQRLAVWRDALEVAVLAAVPCAVVIGRSGPRVGNTTTLALPGTPAETQVMAMDLAGIAVSAGAACSSGKVTPSHVVTALGYDPAIAGSGLRLSAGWQTTEAEINQAATAWIAMAKRLRT